MLKLLVVLVALQLFSNALAAESVNKLGFVPQVAFICNKPAKHMTVAGSWASDDKTGCINQPKQILEYCKKLYPTLEITNVMESPEPTSISNWCKAGQKNCKHSQHTVYPYRCVVGQFESEPLLVPEHCQFDHVHDASKCLPETTWHGRAFEECGKKRMLVQSASMLMPCGTELFSGVEFVCCPKSKIVPATKTAKANDAKPADPMQNFGGALGGFDDDADDDEDYDDDEDIDFEENRSADSILKDLKAGNVGPVVVQADQQSTTPLPAFNVNFDSEDDDEDDYEDDEDYYEPEAPKQKQPAAAASSTTTSKPSGEKDDLPLWRLYLAGDLAGTEHEYDREQQLFEEVMASWRADFGSREDQLKRDWQEAKANVKQTAGDQSALNAVSKEFRRSFNTLKDQGNSEHVRLLDVHDQRIQWRMTARLKVATERLTEVIQKSPVEAEEVADYLEDIIDLEEKQKKHAVNYFSKLRNIQPSSADKVLGDLKTRIRRVEDQLSQSMDMLKKLPQRDMDRIKPEITAYLKTYQDVEDAASLMMRLVPSQKDVPAKLQNIDSSDDDYEDDYESPLGLLEDDDDSDWESEEAEETGAGVEVNNKVKAEMAAIRQEQFVNSSADAGLSTVFMITAGLIATLLTIFVVGLVVYRGMSRRKYAGRMLVTTAISPEERHVNNMQSAGYENPTYKYFYEA